MLYPSDQFGGQELPEAQIPAFAESQGVPSNASGAHLMAKVNVNGPDTDPVWHYAKLAFPGDVKWNFAGLFLFDKAGKCVQRYDGMKTAPDEATIRSML